MRMDLSLDLKGQIYCDICISIRDILWYLFRRKMKEIMSYSTHMLVQVVVHGKDIFRYFSLFWENFTRTDRKFILSDLFSFSGPIGILSNFPK